MVMRNANGVSEVKCEEKEMCQVLRNAGRFFFHENLWDTWSRGLSFARTCVSEERILLQVEIRVCRWEVAAAKMDRPRFT